MPKEIFEVVRERFHLSDRTQYIVQGHWPKDAVMEAYLDQHKLKVSVKENENVSALERFKDPEKMQGIQITATVQIPENLEGYHTGWMSTSCLKKHRIRERQDSSLRSPTFRENACM